MVSKSIAEQIKEARTLIDNSRQHPGIRQALTTFGYPLKNIDRGHLLLEQFLLLHRAMQDQYGAKLNATDTVQTEWQQLKATYDEHLTLAKLAFKNHRGTQQTLGIDRPRPSRRAAYTEQLTRFYNNLLPHHKAMQAYGTTKGELEQARAMVEAFVQAQQQQTQKRGEAQSATQQRNVALKQLQRWVQGYRAIVRVALQDQPQLLEVLGILVRV